MDSLEKKVMRYESQPQSGLSMLIKRYRYKFWTPHRCAHPPIKRYVVNTLLCGHRLRNDSALGLPALPDEMWLLVLSFFPNTWPMYHLVGAPLRCS